MGDDQDDRVRELKERIAGKQGELVRMAEVEEEEETPLRSRGITAAAATPKEAGIHGAEQQGAAWYQGEQDLVAMIRREVGEQTTGIRKSIDELRSSQGCCQDARRREEATTQGLKVVGSREELELRVEEATKKVEVRSEARAKKEEERAVREELVKRAHSGGRALEPKQNLHGASKVGLLNARLRYRKQALINLRQADIRHREEAEKERDRARQKRYSLLQD